MDIVNTERLGISWRKPESWFSFEIHIHNQALHLDLLGLNVTGRFGSTAKKPEPPQAPRQPPKMSAPPGVS